MSPKVKAHYAQTKQLRAWNRTAEGFGISRFLSSVLICFRCYVLIAGTWLKLIQGALLFAA